MGSRPTIPSLRQSIISTLSEWIDSINRKLFGKESYANYVWCQMWAICEQIGVFPGLSRLPFPGLASAIDDVDRLTESDSRCLADGFCESGVGMHGER